MTIFAPVKSTSLREQVVEQVRTAIIEGRLKPNDHIIEKDLTDQLGVSRTPVREALILLEREGLVISVPNRGSFVRAFSEDDVTAIFSMRTVLENFAAEIVINSLSESDFSYLYDLISQQRRNIQHDDFRKLRSIDMRFHQYFVNLAEHPLLQRSWEELVAQIAAVLYIRAEAIPNYDELLAIRDHELIVEAFANRDLEAVKHQHNQINQRVAEECRYSIRALSGK